MDIINEYIDSIDSVKEQCKLDWRRLRDVQAELQNIEPISISVTTGVNVNNTGESSQNDIINPTSQFQIVHEHEKRLKAELQILRERNLRTLPENTSLQLLNIEQDQVKRLEYLKDTLIYSRAMRTEVREIIKQQEEAHSSLSSLNITLKKKVAAIEQVVDQENGGPLDSVLTEITTKVAKVTERDKHFKSILTGILSKYFPLKQHKSGKNILEKSHDVDMNNMLPLKTIIGKLIEQSLNSPEQPYIDIDERFWSPHIEFLLRCQMVLKDPKNSYRMKLVPFHL